MKVIELHSSFGLDQLTLAERPEPTSGRLDVIVKMRAAALNYRDLQVVRGDYLESQHAEFDIPAALRRMVRLHALSVGSRSSFEALVAALEQHHLHPVVDRVFPISKVREALEYLSTGQHVGKIVIDFEGVW